MRLNENMRRKIKNDVVKNIRRLNIKKEYTFISRTTNWIEGQDSMLDCAGLTYPGKRLLFLLIRTR